MAQGNNLQTEVFSARRSKLYSMLESKTAVDPGVWIKDTGFDLGSLELVKNGSGSLTFTVQVYGSNSLDTPTGNGSQIGTDISTLGFVAITTKCRWYKVVITAISAGANTSLSALLHCHSFKS